MAGLVSHIFGKHPPSSPKPNTILRRTFARPQSCENGRARTDRWHHSCNPNSRDAYLVMFHDHCWACLGRASSQSGCTYSSVASPERDIRGSTDSLAGRLARPPFAACSVLEVARHRHKTVLRYHGASGLQSWAIRLPRLQSTARFLTNLPSHASE